MIQDGRFGFGLPQLEQLFIMRNCRANEQIHELATAAASLLDNESNSLLLFAHSRVCFVCNSIFVFIARDRIVVFARERWRGNG